jgi:hypothetical protein
MVHQASGSSVARYGCVLGTGSPRLCFAGVHRAVFSGLRRQYIDRPGCRFANSNCRFAHSKRDCDADCRFADSKRDCYAGTTFGLAVGVDI